MSEPVAQGTGSFWSTLKAVGWSFVGLRKRSDLESDGAKLNPIHIILVGFGAVFFFVVALITLVHWVVAK
jgi:hypothetical protein